MNYRQWKKRYKKLNGVNPPLELDKRRQRKLAKKVFKTISSIDITTLSQRMAEIIKNTAEYCMRILNGVKKALGTMPGINIDTVYANKNSDNNKNKVTI